MRNHAKLKTNPAPIIRFYLSKIQSKKIDKCEWELMDKGRMKQIFEEQRKLIKEKDGVHTIEAEVYGIGIDMWLKSQGDNVKVLN